MLAVAKRVSRVEIKFAVTAKAGPVQTHKGSRWQTRW